MPYYVVVRAPLPVVLFFLLIFFFHDLFISCPLPFSLHFFHSRVFCSSLVRRCSNAFSCRSFLFFSSFHLFSLFLLISLFLSIFHSHLYYIVIASLISCLASLRIPAGEGAVLNVNRREEMTDYQRQTMGASMSLHPAGNGHGHGGHAMGGWNGNAPPPAMGGGADPGRHIRGMSGGGFAGYTPRPRCDCRTKNSTSCM